MSEDTQDASQTDWEGEGGASEPTPTQTTPKGLEIPVPKRRDVLDALKKLIQPARKP